MRALVCCRLGRKIWPHYISLRPKIVPDLLLRQGYSDNWQRQKCTNLATLCDDCAGIMATATDTTLWKSLSEIFSFLRAGNPGSPNAMNTFFSPPCSKAAIRIWLQKKIHLHSLYICLLYHNLTPPHWKALPKDPSISGKFKLCYSQSFTEKMRSVWTRTWTLQNCSRLCRVAIFRWECNKHKDGLDLRKSALQIPPVAVMASLSDISSSPQRWSNCGWCIWITCLSRHCHHHY